MAKRKHRKRQYKTGSIFKRSGSTTFTIRFIDKSRNTHTQQGFATKEEALEALEKALDAPVIAKSAPTLSTLVEKWLEARKRTHENWYCDGLRWKKHLEPTVGTMQPNEVTADTVKNIIDMKFAEGLKSGTVGLIVSLLSTIYSDLVEGPFASSNPVSKLPKKTKRTLKSDHDSESTPFLKTLEDVGTVFASLEAPYNVAFAIGAYAGLRTGEILGLDWSNVDIAGRKIRVCQQVTGNKLKLYPKDGDNRTTIIPNALVPVLEQHRTATGGVGLLFKPLSGRGGALALGGAAPRYVSPATLNEALSKVPLANGLTWYQATRHTFASQWVLNGGTLEILQKLMGHSSVLVTARYAHLKLDTFSPDDLNRMGGNLTGSPA